MSDRHPNLVNESEMDAPTEGNGKRFELRRKRLGAAAGGKRLGCSLLELPPGKAGFPYHYHLANEEAVYVLQGEGVIRLGGQEVPLRPGDYVALPVGAAHAHQVLNNSQAPLRFLAMSTMQEPEVAIYPDSTKLGVLGNTGPDGKRTPLQLHRLGESLGYYDGEE